MSGMQETAHKRFHTSDVQISEDLNFSSLISNADLLHGLTSAGYQRPSPIQLKAIPLGRLGLDVVAQAKSGTGKTIVFSVIAIEAVIGPSSSSSLVTAMPTAAITMPTVLILAPTREIAVQITDVIHNLTSHGLSCAVPCFPMIGGLPIQIDRQNLSNCAIAVGTPGRVKSLMDTGYLNPKKLKLLVLDEADKLMEDIFREDVKAIAKMCGKEKQVMAFSATYDDALLNQLDHMVKNPQYVMLCEGTPELEGVMQYFQTVTLPNDPNSTHTIFAKQSRLMQAKFQALSLLFSRVPFYQAIVFLNHPRRAAELVKYLDQQGWPAMFIASSISQQDRLAIMTKARNFELRVLVCSDLIARGIDIERVNLVVNLDLPRDPETYLHRVGRTGRFGTKGLAISLLDESETKTIGILQKDYGIHIRDLALREEETSSNKDSSTSNNKNLQTNGGDHDDFTEMLRLNQNQHHERPLQSETDRERFEAMMQEQKRKAALWNQEIKVRSQQTPGEEAMGQQKESKRKAMESLDGPRQTRMEKKTKNTPTFITSSVANDSAMLISQEQETKYESKGEMPQESHCFESREEEPESIGTDEIFVVSKSDDNGSIEVNEGGDEQELEEAAFHHTHIGGHLPATPGPFSGYPVTPAFHFYPLPFYSPNGHVPVTPTMPFPFSPGFNLPGIVNPFHPTFSPTSHPPRPFFPPNLSF